MAIKSGSHATNTDDLSSLSGKMQKTDSDKRYRSTGKVAFALFDQVIVSGTNFITLVLVANFTTQKEVGLFHLAWTLVGFSRTLQERMISAPYMVFVHDPKTNIKRLLGSSLMHQVLFALVVCTILLCFSLLSRYTELGKEMGQLCLVLMFSLPFILLRDHIRAICSAKYQYHITILIDISVAIIQIGGILLLVNANLLTLPGIAAVLGLACLIPAVFWVTLRSASYTAKLKYAGPDWTKNWQFSRWLVAARCFGMAGFYAVPWIVVFLMDQASAGIFATASGLVGLSLMFIMGTNNFFQPRAVIALQQHGAQAMQRVVVQTMLTWGLALLAVVVAFYLAGGWFLGTIYGSDYQGYGLVVVWLSLSILTVSPSIACGNGLAALNQPKAYLLGEICYCLVAVASAFILIPIYGLNGAGVALSLAGITASAVSFSILHRLIALQSNNKLQTTA